jgi:tetratricopeptide (TPR) repeat protein
MLLHSLVDDPFYGYGGILIPLSLLPIALLERDGATVLRKLSPGRLKFQPAFAIWPLALAASAILIVLPSGRALIEVNLGAVSQTRAELSLYEWPRYGLPDVLRRTGVADLKPALAHYTTALALDPANAAANRRLGQIQISLSDLEAACSYLDQAYATAPIQRATVQLLGECRALRGQAAQAAQLWRTIDVSEGQLVARQWWYDTYLAAPDAARNFKQAIEALQNQ